jgi:hypothetical protein
VFSWDSLNHFCVSSLSPLNILFSTKSSIMLLLVF